MEHVAPLCFILNGRTYARTSQLVSLGHLSRDDLKMTDLEVDRPTAVRNRADSDG